MEVNELQDRIVKYAQLWEEKQNRPATERFVFIHLVEEIGELAREYVSAEIRPDRFDDGRLNNAIADTLLLLFRLADLRELDVERLALGTIEADMPRLADR